MEIKFQENKYFESKIKEFVESKGNWSQQTLSRKKGMLYKLIRGCKNCSLRYDTKFKPIPSIINGGSKVIFIGRNPCKTEALENKLYPEGTHLGKCFEKYLSILEVPNCEISVINMCNCVSSGNRPPCSEHIDRCVAIKSLEWELIGDSFKVLFLMGNDAVRYVFGKNAPGVLAIHGNFIKATYKGRDIIVIPILHPNHLLIQPEYREECFKVLKEAGRVIKPYLK